MIGLRAFRLRHGITQVELSTGSGVPQSVISKLENGGDASLKSMRKIVEYVQTFEPEMTWDSLFWFGRVIHSTDAPDHDSPTVLWCHPKESAE